MRQGEVVHRRGRDRQGADPLTEQPSRYV